MIRIERVNFPEREESSIIHDWRNLRAQCGCQFAFSDPGWLSSWWDVFKKQYVPLVLAAYQGNSLVGMFPLMLTRGKACRHCRVLGSPEATHTEFAVLPEYIEEAVVRLMEALDSLEGRVLFELSGINKESAVYLAMLQCLDTAHRRHLEVAVPSPVIHTGGQDYKTYLNRRFSTHNRHNMKRNEKRLEMLGQVSARPLTPNDMPNVFKLHNARWQEKLDTSGFDNENSKRFFTDLLCHKDGWQAMVLGLFLDERLIAFQYGFLCNGRALFYRSAHDNLFSIYAPGKQIKRQYIGFCFENNIRDIDLGIGYEEYKEEWTNDQDILYNIYFSKQDLISRLHFVWVNRKYSFKAKLKENRHIVLFKRNTLGKIKYVLSLRTLPAYCRRLFASIKRRGFFCYLLEKFGLVHNTILQPPAGGEAALPVYGEAVPVVRAGVEDMEALSWLFVCPVGEVVRRFYRQGECLLVKRQGEIVCAVFLSSVQGGMLAECRTHKVLCRAQDAEALAAEIMAYVGARGAKGISLTLPRGERRCLNAVKRAGFRAV